MESNIINTRRDGERVTSNYAEIYFDDTYCQEKEIGKNVSEKVKEYPIQCNEKENDFEWTSPSDNLIGLIELKPPFTSKITRGITHEGILSIGNDVLENERNTFARHLKGLLRDNDSSWNHVLLHEIERVTKKVRSIYKKIFLDKSKIMAKEVAVFYEDSLKTLEKYLINEIQPVLMCGHANIISDLNDQIKRKMRKEKSILEKKLLERYTNEIVKVEAYYRFLLLNERQRQDEALNAIIVERNDALNAFCKQLEAESLTSSMYILSTERKKCQINKFLLNNYLTVEISEKIKEIKERQEILDYYKKKDLRLSQINKDWEEKIKKILELFLKFMSFSLRLLPEQTTFLLDLKKILVLQLNEIQKEPLTAPLILIDDEKLQNIFQFEDSKIMEKECTEKPFVIEGDLTDPPEVRYGSRETLPSEVDLPTIRLQRKFVYAKCHKFNEIAAFLESQRCKCQDLHSKPPSQTDELSTDQPTTSIPMNTVSSMELLLANDINRLDQCPGRRCQDWAKKYSFPYLNSYLDYTEENFKRVKTILGQPKPSPSPPELLQARDIALRELPFSATKEPFHNVSTQYSSMDDITMPDAINCTCLDNDSPKPSESHYKSIKSSSVKLDHISLKRQQSIRRLIEKHPNLLMFLNDENFDFQIL